MADIIKFQEYVDSKDEEKNRTKRISVLSTKRKDIEELIHNINSCIGCSFVTKHFSGMNQIVGKENIIDSDTLDVIIKSLDGYYDEICGQIKELSSHCTNTITTC